LFSCLSYFGDSGARARILPGQEVARVSPHILKYLKYQTIFLVRCKLRERITAGSCLLLEGRPDAPVASHDLQAVFLLQEIKLFLENKHRYLSLSDISSIQTIQAIGPEYAPLGHMNLPREPVLHEEAKLLQESFNFLHQVIQSLEVVSFCFRVEIE